MKLRILFVIENICFGGGERAFAQMINGLDKGKYEIYVACLPGGIFEEKIRTSAEILPFDLRNRFNLANIYQLAKIMREKNIEIVHSQGGRADFFTRVAAKLTGVPVVISTVQMPVEGYDVGILRKMLYVSLDRITERFVDRVIVVSEALKHVMIAGHGIRSDKVVRVSNGVELDRYDPNLHSGNGVRENLNISQGVPLIGAIGRLVWQKGLEFLVGAAPIVLNYVPDAKFLLVGEGPLEVELRNLAERSGFSERVLFTGFRSDMPEVLSALDVLVLPSLREGLPMILLEGMAMAKPIVTTNIEGISEVVEHDKTGVLVPPGNSQILAEGIIGLLKDKDKAQQIGQAGRKRVEEAFSVEMMVKKTEEGYESVVMEKLGGR